MDFLKDAARRAPESLALDDSGRSWTYAELDGWVGLVAERLQASLALPGPVALLLETGEPLVTCLHAVARAGRVLVPLNPRLTAFELAAALRALDVAALIVEPEGESVARSACERGELEVPLLVTSRMDSWGKGAAQASCASSSTQPRPPLPDEAWAILWTSGTAGRARGVVLSALNLVASATASAARLRLDGADRWYLGLSCAHVGGLALVTRAALLGAAVVTRGPFSAERFNLLVDEGRVTHASLVPTMLFRVLEERSDRRAPASLRCLLLGGAGTPRLLVERALDAGFPVALTYGLTEACSQVATATPELVARKPGTVGPPLPGVDVQVQEDGEIVVRGPTVALGFAHDQRPLTDENGWLRTGDVGALDGEGHLHVTGRRSQRIVTGGINVDPSEVEAVLRLHERVEDVAVVGLPDPEWGEIVAAAVVARRGATLDGAALQALARERLAPAKLPRRLVFLPELPRNVNGKVDLAAVRAVLKPSPNPHG